MMKRILALLILCLLAVPALAQASALSSGSTGDEVVALQQRLAELGLSTGSVDGVYGKQTASAVKEAQRLLIAAGYDVALSGKADQDTLALLYDETAEAALRTLRRGSKGERVRDLQYRLIDLKLLSGAADGAYGSNTEEAVRAFQRYMLKQGATGIQEDGAATPALIDLLMGDLSAYGFADPADFDESNPLSLTPDYLYAKACILVDAPTGNVLFESAADEPLPPASTTKIMTLLLAIEQGGLQETVVIPECAKDVPKDSSLVPVSVGEQMRMQDLLYGLIIRSGNDAANAVAELCAGSVEAFVERMNQRAKELGMANTRFANPHGYHDSQHYTTARDLAILTRQGLTDAAFCQIVTCLSYTMPATSQRGELVLQNTYEIFDPASPYYIAGAAGVKSGYTSNAGFCYVGAAQRDGRTLIAVILGDATRNRGWTDLKRLFAYGFAQP